MAAILQPGRYRIVLFDQRGSGRSTPHASRPDIDLATNTTQHLLGDIELLRRHLGVERWLLLGGSWGTTLALAYAEQHPTRVTEMVLEGIATTTTWEVAWITRGVGAFFPDAWQRFRSGVPEAERAGSLVDAYHRLLMHPDPAIHEKAARDWCDWEAAIVALHANDKPSPRYENPAFRLGFARLVTHYWRHHTWLEDGALVRDAHRLSRIPGILIHGRMDLCNPLLTPWRLAQIGRAANSSSSTRPATMPATRASPITSSLQPIVSQPNSIPPPPTWGRVGVGEASDDSLPPKRGFPLPTLPQLWEGI